MPKTLYLHILTEVARIVAVAAGALVLVMAFATAVKPLSEGMLGADTLIKFVIYMSPSMLQYALPFAAAMGGTLVYLRMSQDNEILACQASGFDCKSLVAPAAICGVVLMVLLLVLSGGIGPAFYRRAERTACGDILGTMVRKLNQRQPFVQENGGGGMALFANQARVEDVPPGALAGGVVPEYVVALSGVVVAQLDGHGGMGRNITAKGATAMLYHDALSGDALVSIRLTEPQLMSNGQSGGSAAYFGTAKAVDHIHLVLPNLVRDKVEFLSLTELWGVLAHPENFDGVRQKLGKLRDAVAAERFRRSVTAALPAGVPLRGPLGDERYTVSAPAAAVDGGELVLSSTPGAKVAVEHRIGAALLRRWEGESGRMRFKRDDETGEPVAVLALRRVRVSDPRSPGVVSAKPEYEFDALAWPAPMLGDINGLSVDDWLDKTGAAAEQVPALAAARQDLILEKETLRRKVIAQANLRVSSAAMCLLLAVLGAAMSLWRRHSLPLVVFFWCFLIAVLSIIMVNTGYNIARGAGPRFGGGLVLIWLPVLIQAGINGWILRHLGKPGR